MDATRLTKAAQTTNYKLKNLWRQFLGARRLYASLTKIYCRRQTQGAWISKNGGPYKEKINLHAQPEQKSEVAVPNEPQIPLSIAVKSVDDGWAQVFEIVAQDPVCHANESDNKEHHAFEWGPLKRTWSR